MLDDSSLKNISDTLLIVHAVLKQIGFKFLKQKSQLIIPTTCDSCKFKTENISSVVHKESYITKK